MSDIYQSRVFTFIGNRTNQLKNSCAKGLRHLKVVVVWSTQILLYPLQLLAQTKIFQPQISTPPPAPTLPQPVPDINIEQALDLVEVAGYPIQIAQSATLVADDWSYIDDNLWNTSLGNPTIASRDITYSPRRSEQITPPKPIIHGLSSLLSDRQLVLVTTKNELLNILTIAQQQEIRRRIGRDLATTWEQWHPDQFSDRDSTTAISDHPQLLLTDRSIADRPKIEIPPQDSTSVTLLDRLRNWFQTSIGNSPQPEVNPSLASNSQPQLAPSAFLFTPQPPQIDRYLNLPQLPPIVEDNLPIKAEPIAKLTIVNIANKLSPNWLKQWWEYYREYIYIPSTDLAIVHQPEEFELIPIEPPLQQPQTGELSQLKSHQTHQFNIAGIKSPKTSQHSPQLSAATTSKITTKFTTELEYHQDWIETEAEMIGYSQSLIVKLLAWLDRLVFWIENWVINIFGRIFNRST